MDKKVECCSHGSRNAAYACIHTVESLQDSIPRGLIYVVDDDGCFNGYCDQCDAVLEKYGGEWNDESESFAQAKLICEGCFERAIKINA